MSYECKILADSVSNRGHRITTFEITFPRFILAEVNTHRMLSRNSASSRAIPTEKIIQRVVDEPFMPEFNERVKGMGVGVILDGQEQAYAQLTWLSARSAAVDHAESLRHTDKSRVNRLLEPFMWHTAIVTGTDWDNFFELRTAEDAQPEFKIIADMMKEAYITNVPRYIGSRGWHIPLIDAEDEDRAFWYHDPYEYLRQISIGRCARVSYLTHDGKRDPQEDIAMYGRLKTSKHMSPFEHVARPFTEKEWDFIDDICDVIPDGDLTGFIEYRRKQLEYVGNLRGWVSERMSIEYGI